ncbi:hypothetical protein SLS58_002907 [Diplodia intermedia]|uniref:Uncharacterized protein n=1 Tax=Diplodia intermedia TaxID=856260 RepID=A0ABR3TYL6_9PEZI
MVLHDYDPDFGEKVCRRYRYSVISAESDQKFRIRKYGAEAAAKYRRGSTPQSLRDAYWADQEERERRILLSTPGGSSDDEPYQVPDNSIDNRSPPGKRNRKRKHTDDTDSEPARKRKRNDNKSSDESRPVKKPKFNFQSEAIQYNFLSLTEAA